MRGPVQTVYMDIGKKLFKNSFIVEKEIFSPT